MVANTATAAAIRRPGVCPTQIARPRDLVPALRTVRAQVRLRELGEVLGRDEYEKTEQHHRCDVRAHAGAILRSVAISFELREVEHAKDVVGSHVVDRISAVSRSRSKRYDISPMVGLIGFHVAPQTTVRVAIKILMIGPALAGRSRNSWAAGAIARDAAAIVRARIPIVSVCCLPRWMSSPARKIRELGIDRCSICALAFSPRSNMTVCTECRTQSLF